MGFLKQYHIFNRILALFLACCLWVIAINDQNPIRPRVYKNIPITLLGENALSERGLMVIGGLDTPIELHVSGQAEYIQTLDRTPLHADVDVSSITTTGTHTMPYTVLLPDGIVREQLTPDSILLTIDRIETRDIPVQLALEGTVPSGYHIGTPESHQKTVRVRGAVSILDTIAYAKVPITTDDIDQIGKRSYPYTLIGAEDKEIQSPYVEHMTGRVSVRVPIYHTATIPLTVEMQGNHAIGEEMATVSITPTAIEVYGAEKDIQTLRSIRLGTVDLSSITTETEKIFPIRLPNGIYCDETQPSKASVVVRMADGLESRTFHITHITLENMAETNLHPTIQTEGLTVDVTLRGQTSALDALSAEQIKAIAKYDATMLKNGENAIPVFIELPEDSKVAIVHYTSTIHVQVTGLPAVQGEPR